MLHLIYQRKKMEAEVVNNSSTLIRDVVLILLFVNFIASCWLHYKGKLSVYSDYTDVAFTVLGTVGVIIIAIFFKFLSVSDEVIKYICIGLFSFIALIVVIKSIRVNGFFYGLMAFICKYSVMSFYIFAVFKIFTSGGTARKSGETKRSYQSRQRREFKNQVWCASLITLSIGYLTKITVRNEEFVSVEQYLERDEVEDSESIEH